MIVSARALCRYGNVYVTDGGPARIHYVIEIGISGARLFEELCCFICFALYGVLDIQHLEVHYSRGSSLSAMVYVG